MIRMFMALGMSLLLAACWTSERFFDDGDWAKLDLDGIYDIETPGDSDTTRQIALVSRSDGLIEAIPSDDPEDRNLLGLVPISGGSGNFFLAMDRADPDDGDLYFLAHLTDQRALAFYLPDCDGTPPTEGMVIEDQGKSGKACIFGSKDALMRAALEAERFLSARHIIAVAPFRLLVPVE